MFAILHALGMLIADLFKSRVRLEAEILLLRHQLNLALRYAPPRVRLRRGDRAFMVWMVRLWLRLLDIVRVGSAGDRAAVAPRWFPSPLALEVAEASRAAQDWPGTARSDPAD